MPETPLFETNIQQGDLFTGYKVTFKKKKNYNPPLHQRAKLLMDNLGFNQITFQGQASQPRRYHLHCSKR
jgi:hypothetical protein